MNFRLGFEKLQRIGLLSRFFTWETYRHSFKFPEHPKFVVLSSTNPLAQLVIDNHFKNYAAVNGAEKSSQAVAETLIQESTVNSGALLYNFPQNPQQAEELDRLLDGVNLAIHIKLSPTLQQKIQESYLSCSTCKKVFNAQLPFLAPTHPGYENNCPKPTSCNMEKTTVGTANDANTDLVQYYKTRGLLFEFELDESHLEQSSQEFAEKFENAITASVKL